MPPKQGIEAAETNPKKPEKKVRIVSIFPLVLLFVYSMYGTSLMVFNCSGFDCFFGNFWIVDFRIRGFRLIRCI